MAVAIVVAAAPDAAAIAGRNSDRPIACVDTASSGFGARMSAESFACTDPSVAFNG